MKLTIKILLLLLLIVVLVTTVAGVLSVRAAYANLEERQQALTVQLAGEIEGRLLAASRRAGPIGVQVALREWADETNQTSYMRVVIFSDQVERRLRPKVPRDVWPVILRREVSSYVSEDEQHVRSLHTYLPMNLFVDQPSALEMTQSLSPLDDQSRQLVYGSLMAIGASAWLGLVLAYMAGVRWVARPLGALVAHTEKIGRGDFSARTELASGDELDQLAQALNAMSQRLSTQQATIVRQTEDRLAALQQLRHADRLGTLGRMAAGIAHELGTPLNVVAGRAALIATGKLSADEVTFSAQTIKAEADRITSIVRRMLDFARQRRPQTSRCDLMQLIERTISLVVTIADKRDIQLSVSTASSSLVAPNNQVAPSSHIENQDQLQATIDEAQIQQVLTNLIVNALQATPIKGRVEVSVAAVDDHWLRLVVDDSGPGVPVELRERIFEPFFTTKDVGEGTGLGLSIAYGIVQEHAGRLVVGDSPLGGARFEIWLPRSERTESQLDTSTAHTIQATAKQPLLPGIQPRVEPGVKPGVVPAIEEVEPATLTSVLPNARPVNQAEKEEPQS